jgi:hypothetical protein
VKRLQAAIVIGVAAIVGVTVLAVVVRPLLPWLLAAFVFACILRIVTRGS